MPDETAGGGGDPRVSISANLSERVARSEEQLRGLDRLMHVHLALRDRALTEARDVAKEAADLVRQATVKAEAQSNEWRGSLADLGDRKADRKDTDSALAAVSARVDELKQYIDQQSGGHAQSVSSREWIGWAVGAFAALIGIALVIGANVR